jgi:hypothetical protein
MLGCSAVCLHKPTTLMAFQKTAFRVPNIH